MDNDDDFEEMFEEFYNQGWECEFGNPQGIWISPEGQRLEPDHPRSPLSLLGLN